jgi:hypothetical protein
MTGYGSGVISHPALPTIPTEPSVVVPLIGNRTRAASLSTGSRTESSVYPRPQRTPPPRSAADRVRRSHGHIPITAGVPKP